MEKPTIGIRQADGSFYEIMGDAQSGHKRLVLSAARTDQHGVRIDLYRSTDGQVDPEGALGSIALDDPEGLGYQDIEFRVDLDAEGQLNATAKLPGQPPQSLAVDLARFRQAETSAAPALDEFSMDDLPGLDPEPMTLDLPDLDDLDMQMEGETPRRSDTDLLADDALASAEVDTLDDFSIEQGPDLELDPELSLDLPPVEEEPRRSDTDILEDSSFESAELDTLDDFSFEDDAGGTPETRGLDSLDTPDAADKTDDFSLDDLGTMDDLSTDDLAADDFAMPDLEDDLDTPASAPAAPAAAAPAFDLDDLDAGFGDEPVPQASEEPADEWEKISLDDMEPMEFLDTGAEISAPPKAPKSEFAMDDDEPLELADFDSELGDLPDMGDDSAPPAAPDSFDSFDNDLDQDFLAPTALTEPAPWDSDDSLDEAPVSSGKPGKAPKPAKPAKAPKAAKAARSAEPAPSGSNGVVDKAALLLALSALSLLVLLILVLLFLNMIKAPLAPVIQPEVERWQETSTAQGSEQPPVADALDLGAAHPLGLEASSVLEIPSTLRTARISLRLEPGDTAEDASARFGTPARVQGNLLSW